MRIYYALPMRKSINLEVYEYKVDGY